MTSTQTSRPGLMTFGVLWLGQLVSILGSGLTSFALGIWVYEQTGSVTQFATMTLCAVAPIVLLAPVAGVVVDRWDRKWVMLASDTLAALSTLSLLVLYTGGNLRLWQVYLGVCLTAVAESFQEPAFMAASTVLVPERHLGRASGMVQLAQAAGRTLAPPLAGLLLMHHGLATVMTLDLMAFAIAVVTTLLVRVPRPTRSAQGEQQARESLGSNLTFGMRYIFQQPGLLGLLAFFSIVNLTLGLAEILVTPLVLKAFTPTLLGQVLACSGVGMLVGSALMTVWGGPKRRLTGIVGAGLLYGVSLALSGLQPSLPLIAAAAFLLMFFNAPIASCSQALWQSLVPADLQGRVFSARMALAWFSTPVAYLVGGPLADHVFEPAMLAGGALEPVFGGLLGSGPGRGIALMLVMMGLLAVLAAIALSLFRPARALESNIPEASPRAVSPV
ncbi:MFS transporter [Corallococcus sp. ZKHCc1 1396]|uniref:MFS transporter n=1 Tax=Corallococcus soli TaxID=2710757 RepID=A0ABR9PM52_9BACT|nr:MFS transporter [Corallococcus soli]MBE4749006.1 MFS transporter [Corallococcus soli]